DLAPPAPSRALGKTVAHQNADLRRAYPIARRDPHIRDPLVARSAGVPDSCAPPPRPALVYNVPPERGLPRRHDLLEFVSPRFGRVDAPVVVVRGDIVHAIHAEELHHVAVAQEMDGVLGNAACAVEGIRLQLLGTVKFLAIEIVRVPATKLIRRSTHAPPIVVRPRPPSWAKIPLADHRGDAQHVEETSAPRLAPERAGQRVHVR